MAFKRNKAVEKIILRARGKMRPWGITITYLAMQLGVSRQYVWQIVYYKGMISLEKATSLERMIDETIAERRHLSSFGARLRAARISAGLTLKQTADLIGYTWIAIERWEQNKCLPKPGVLWHLRTVYGVGEDWLPLPQEFHLKNTA